MLCISLRRRTRRRLTQLVVLSLIILSLGHLFLPFDSSIRLAIAFNSTRFWNFLFGSPHKRDAWLAHPARHPAVRLNEDVGFLIKTGYGTRGRVQEQIKAFAQSGIPLDENRNLVLVGDWTTTQGTGNFVHGVRVHDAIERVLHSPEGRILQSHERFSKYTALQRAIDSGNEKEALHVAQTVGWELDALKFIPGMELLHKNIPHKKWYFLLDDDSYIVKPSLELMLSLLDPAVPQYIGNAVGDYKARFGHGGSGIIISGSAMRLLFERRDVVSAALQDSMDETWGDRLVALTLQKMGIYIEERYSHYFNGESPRLTKISRDRFCSPIASFHGLRSPGAMVEAGRRVGIRGGATRWAQVWVLYGMSSELPDMEKGRDHVGSQDEGSKTWKNVRDAKGCKRKCEKHKSLCLAWTYEEDTRQCHVSPWIIVGEEGHSSKISGVHKAVVKPLLDKCGQL